MEYNREKAVAYAHRWAFDRNPKYYNFDGLGGDCANFASQCIYEGCGVMDYTPVYGWYYINANKRAPGWSGVQYLQNFLLKNTPAGPQAKEAPLEALEQGDIIQLGTFVGEYYHTLVVVDTDQSGLTSGVLVACHTYDSDNRPLSTYDIQVMKTMHIYGVKG